MEARARESILRQFCDITVIPKPWCPGYKLYVFNPTNQDIGVGDGPQPDIQYCPVRRVPYTKICDHNPCEADTEFEFYLIQQVAKGAISSAQYTHLFPRRVNTSGRRLPLSGVPNSLLNLSAPGVPPECRGFKITKGPLAARAHPFQIQEAWDFDPTTLDPYTAICEHDPCQPAVEAEFAVYKAIASGVLGDEDAVAPIFVIHNEGWGRKMHGKTPDERRLYLLDSRVWPLALEDVLWNPMKLTDLESQLIVPNQTSLKLSTWTKVSLLLDNLFLILLFLICR